MESSGAIIDRVMREQQKQIMELQQQNKQLIETLETVNAYLDKGWYITAGQTIDETIQQIQGKDDER